VETDDCPCPALAAARVPPHHLRTVPSTVVSFACPLRSTRMPQDERGFPGTSPACVADPSARERAQPGNGGVRGWSGFRTVKTESDRFDLAPHRWGAPRHDASRRASSPVTYLPTGSGSSRRPETGRVLRAWTTQSHRRGPHQSGQSSSPRYKVACPCFHASCPVSVFRDLRAQPNSCVSVRKRVFSFLFFRFPSKTIRNHKSAPQFPLKYKPLPVHAFKVNYRYMSVRDHDQLITIVGRGSR
jgi:hypothetical protein